MSTGPPGWLKYGCLGALVVGLLVIPAALVGRAWLDVQSEQVEDRVLAPAIPSLPLRPGGRVRVDIRDAELSLELAPPGEALRVEAHYDTKSFALEHRLDPEAQDGPWTYELTFDRIGGTRTSAALRSLLGGTEARVRVLLPADVPIALDIAMREGGAFLRLGGLWLTSADIDLSKGGLDLDVEEPTREPMERLSIRCSMGGASLSRIGNASPRKLDVDYSMGGLNLDLTGRWSSDSEISLHGSRAGGAVQLPPDVAVLGLDRVEAAAESEVAPWTLTFSTGGGTEALQFYE